MRLKRHRKDIQTIRDSWASMGMPPVVVDTVKRYQHLVSWAEAVLSWPTFEITQAMERREKKVIRDSKE